jgi:transcriptional regulator with XRE-family HTH domain
MNQLAISVLLQELRGEISQLELSHALGYEYNQYFKWESGNTAITLLNFIDLCNYLKVDLKIIFDDFLYYRLDAYNQSDLLSNIYTRWCHHSDEKFLKLTKFSKSKWWRLKTGKVKLTLSDFIVFLDTVIERKNVFLKLISKNFKAKKYLHAKSLNDDVLLMTIKEYPEFAVIYSSLFLKDYILAKTTAARKKILIRTTNINEKRLDIILNHLQQNEILDSEYKSLQEPFRVKLSKINLEVNDIFAAYCLKVHLNGITPIRKKDNIAASPILAAVSEETRIKIYDILTKCQSEIAQAISNDNKSGKTEILNVYLGAIY